jgi:hypothetical protein
MSSHAVNIILESKAIDKNIFFISLSINYN